MAEIFAGRFPSCRVAYHSAVWLNNWHRAANTFFMKLFVFDHLAKTYYYISSLGSCSLYNSLLWALSFRSRLLFIVWPSLLHLGSLVPLTSRTVTFAFSAVEAIVQQKCMPPTLCPLLFSYVLYHSVLFCFVFFSSVLCCFLSCSLLFSCLQTFWETNLFNFATQRA